MIDDPLIQALQLLPHGPEFRFIDQLLFLDPGKTGTGEYTVRDSEIFLRGHFPGNPLFPGVLLLEGAAQLSGIVAQSDPKIVPLNDLKLTALRAAKILRTAQPGDRIQFSAEILGRLSNLVHAKVSASIKNELALQGEITLSGVIKA